MSRHRRRYQRERDDQNAGRREDPDLGRAVSKLEEALTDLLGDAKDELSSRAAKLIDDAAERLEDELDDWVDRDERVSRRRHRQRRRMKRDTENALKPRSRRLYRNPQRAKIGGVCAGIADYMGAETWVVRCVAITGLMFMPSLVFPAYWLAYFFLDKKPLTGDALRAAAEAQRNDHRSPAPELGPRLSPRRSLRNVQADITEAELRLRRMETHITSGRYELQREISALERSGPEHPGPAPA